MSHASAIVAVEGPITEVEKQVEWEMEPFHEQTAWFEDGSRWDWYQIGGRMSGMLGGPDIIKKSELSFAQIKSVKTSWAQEVWEILQKDIKQHGKPVFPPRDYDPSDTFQQFLEKRVRIPLSAYAFLSNRHWHEGERMGWWGTSAYTECEIRDMNKPKADPDKWFQKCLYKMDDKQAQVVCWNEPWEIWAQNYFSRFIEPLHPDKWLAVVDYHV